MTRRFLTITASLCLLLVVPVHAGEVDVPALPSDIPPPPPTEDGVLYLDLERAYELALQRNLDLQVGRYDLAVSDTGIARQTGVFDVGLNAGLDGGFTKSPAVSELEGVGADVTETRNANYSLGLGQLLPSGTQWQVSMTTRRTETNSAFYFLSPSYSSDFTATLTQPLLQGFGTTVNRSGIIVARNARDQTATGFELQLIGTLQLVEQAYWDMVAARQAVEVQEQSLELAQRLLDETRERVKVGTSAPIDIVQSEAGVATRRRELIYGRNAAANAEDALKAVLGFDQPDEWMRSIEATEPYEIDTFKSDLSEAIRLAIANRPEMHQQQLAMDYLEHNVAVARNTVLPSLDLQVNWGHGGLSGKGEITSVVTDPETGLPVIDPETGQPVTQTIIIDSDAVDSWQQIWDRDFPQWTVGAVFALPLGNHNAKATLAQRRYELQKGKVQTAALQQQIIHEVRRAVRALDDGAAAIEAAIAERTLSARNLEAEQTKFANGLSTNYQVLLIQEDLATARLSEIRARIDYRNIIVGYRVNTGTLLDTLSVEVVDPGQPKVAHDYWKNVKWLRGPNTAVTFDDDTMTAKPVPPEVGGE